MTQNPIAISHYKQLHKPKIYITCKVVYMLENCTFPFVELSSSITNKGKIESLEFGFGN
jgi:hypothetical protein